MATLKEPVKIFIVQSLACFETPQQVADTVKQEFGIEINRKQVQLYDPTKQAGRNLSKKLKDLFERTRKDFKEKELGESLEKVGISKEYLGHKVCELSGGEQQRIAIARTMLKPCEIILADEPTGNLDTSNKEKIIHLFKELKKEGKTIVCVTHDEEMAKSADRIIDLKKERGREK